jgi:hypothetical protein
MKKGITGMLLMVLLVLLAGNACRSGNSNDKQLFVADAEYVQIVLFHLAQRCESCNAVEHETEWLLEQEYREDVLSGKIQFVPLNYQDENAKKAARLLQASGQTLYVIKGDSIADLTSAAFMYASTHPEYYRDALRKALDQYLE